MNETSEFSFYLKPSTHGVGVFAVHDIVKGTHLRLFGNLEAKASMLRPKDQVPEFFHQYCMDRGDELECPIDFGAMHLGWYLNHSKQSNATHDHNFEWYAARDIKAGEEILVDYNSLEEPDDARSDYYNN